MLTSDFWADTDFVINGPYRARITEERLPDPRFGDQYWNFAALQFRGNDRAPTFDFDAQFPDEMQNLTARELAMQRLNKPVAPVQGHRRATVTHPASLVPALYSLRDFYRFMGRHSIVRLQDVDQGLLDNYVRYLSNERALDPAHAAHKIGIIYWLYEARHTIEDSIQFVPWNGISANSIFDVKRVTENKTPRIPESVIEPLIKWSMAYIENFSHDIIGLNAVNQTTYYAKEKICRNSSNGLSVEWVNRINLAFKHLSVVDECGYGTRPVKSKYHSNLLKKAHPALKNRSAELDLDIASMIESTPRFVADYNKNWRPPFTTARDLGVECRNLTAACYIICAYLSGMRDSEIFAMTDSSVSTLRDSNGGIIRHYVASIEYKGKKKREGIKRTWVVLSPVKCAVDVMTDLGLIDRIDHNLNNLFAVSKYSKSGSISKFNDWINARINDFIHHINSTIEPWLDNPELPPIPIEDFQPVTTRMFRRTIAWFIANRPFGLVAGMIQYGHASTQIFEGYAGTSSSGFRQEVEKERVLARMNDIVEMYSEHGLGTKVAGPMADSLRPEFEYIRKVLGDFPGMIVKEGQREKMLSHLSKNFYPGQLADCFFEPNRAKCLEKTGSFMHEEPIRGLCDPNCDNACWRKKHMSVWQMALADVGRLSRKNRLSAIQRGILKSKKEQYEMMIEALTSASGSDAS